MAEILKVKQKNPFDEFMRSMFPNIFTEENIQKVYRWIDELPAFNQLLDSLDKLKLPDETKVAIIVEVINKKYGLNIELQQIVLMSQDRAILN